MAKRHVIRQGECIHSIAANEGLFWRTIWEHNGNTALRKKRPDPAVLLAGDEVFIPDKRRKTVSIATGRSSMTELPSTSSGTQEPTISPTASSIPSSRMRPMARNAGSTIPGSAREKQRSLAR